MNHKTAGTEFAAEIARYFHIGPRTRRYRNGEDLHGRIVEAAILAAQYPGYYTERSEVPFKRAFAAANGYNKHIRGYRMSGEIVAKVNTMSPHQFAKLLGRMIDAGVSNVYEAEVFFQDL